VTVKKSFFCIGFDLKYPSIVYEDNTATEQMVKTNAITERNKHIRVRCHYVRECVRDGMLRFTRVSSKENAADALTKPTDRNGINVTLKAAGMKAMNGSVP